MSKNKLMLNELLSWQDVINFGLDGYSFGCGFLEKSFPKKNQYDYVSNYIRTEVDKIIKSNMSLFPFHPECFNHHFSIIDGKLYIDYVSFFSDLLHACSNRELNSIRIANIAYYENPTFKEDIINELKLYKEQINDDITKCNTKNLLMGYNPEYGVKTTKEELKETLFAKRKMIIWIIRHFDELYQFVQEPIDLNILNIFNKDKFMLIMASYALSETGILSGKLNISKAHGLNTINDYLLLVDYLTEENNEKYNVNFKTQLRNGSDLIMATDTVRDLFNKFLCSNEDILDSYKFASSYEEILQTKAQNTWQNIQNKKLAQKIKLNWEMIPAGNKVSLSNYQSGTKTRIVSSNSDKQAKLKKDYDLVEEKMEFFSNTTPLFELTGIDTFEGYSAYMYSNGVVVFEKFFKQSGNSKGKSMMVPVSGEAIYVMNFQEFADLSKYTKVELIQEIHDFNNPDVKRIYHTPNGSWKDKVNKIITGPGYGMLNLQQIDVLTNELVSEAKQKVKKIEE